MSAILPQIIEPANNVVRLGQEATSQIQRKASAKVLFPNPTGTLNLIDPNVPAIPWTSSTGFGHGVTPPTTPGTVDLVNGYSRFVTFILAGANNSVQPMYVCATADWPAIAGAEGGRTAIPLDLWELHSWRYCGPEFVVDQTITKSGTYATSGGVAVAASTDVTTHGDYGYQDITFSPAFPAGVTPDVVATSDDPDFVTWVDRANTSDTQVRIYVRRLRSLSEPLSGELDLTIPSGGNAIDALVTFGVTYDAKPVVQVEVDEDASGVDGESQYQASLHDRSTTNFYAVIFHMPHPTPLTSSTNATNTTAPSVADTLGMNSTPIVTSAPSANVTSSAGVVATTVNGAGANHAHTENTAATYQVNATTSTNSNTHSHTGGTHTHDLSNHTHNNGDHTHNMNGHTHTLNNHSHTVDVFPNEGSNRTLRVGWVAYGRRNAAATHVPISWIARG